MKRDQLIFLGVLLAGAIIAVVIVLATGGDDDSSPVPTKPEVEVPAGPPPKELEIEDLSEGDGAEAAEGDTLTVEYVGVKYSDGSEFDTSWDTPEPFTVQLGAGGVIPGWEQGLQGMKAGGQRQLIIPPDLAYGKQGFPPDIGPNETLIFVIDLLELQPG